MSTTRETITAALDASGYAVENHGWTVTGMLGDTTVTVMFTARGAVSQSSVHRTQTSGTVPTSMVDSVQGGRDKAARVIRMAKHYAGYAVVGTPEPVRTDELDSGVDSHGRTPEQNADSDAPTWTTTQHWTPDNDAPVTDPHVKGNCAMFDNRGNVTHNIIGAHCHCTLESYYRATGQVLECRVCEPAAIELPYVVTRVYDTDAPVVLQAQAERVQANTRGVHVTALNNHTRASIADWVARDPASVVQYVYRAVVDARIDSDIRDAGTRLGAWVTLQARKIQADASVFPEFVSDAPSTYAELLQATARWEFELGAAYLPVWNGACDSTIYPDAVTNMLFRFWHDYGHIANHLSFAPANETALQTMHHLPLVAAEFGVDSLEYRVYYADTIGQIEYERDNGFFPDNQFKFVRAYLQNPRLALNTSYAA